MRNRAGVVMAGESNLGLYRRRNEDSFCCYAPSGRDCALAVVADGVGGHANAALIHHMIRLGHTHPNGIPKANVGSLVGTGALRLHAHLGQHRLQICIQAAGAASKKDMGKVMALLMPQVKGKADGKLVNEIVSALLP